MNRPVSAAADSLVAPPRASGASLVARRRAFRALVRLAASRLRKVRGARVGRLLALGVGIVGALVAVGLRIADGPGAAVEGLVVGVGKWAMWIGAGSVALAAANGRTVADRRDGLELMAFSHGASPRTLSSARVVATSLEVARAAMTPSLVVGITALACSGSARTALVRALLLVVLGVFSALGGLSLGAIAAIADRARPAGGRGLFLAVVIAPWAALDLVGRGAFSVPGALGAVLSLGLDAIGLGRLG